MNIRTSDFTKTNLAYGCVLASWQTGFAIHPDITFQGNNGAWVTIASDEYDVHSTLGAVVKRAYDNDGNAVDWSSYTSFRCTYARFNTTTATLDGVSTFTRQQKSNETQTVGYQDFGIAPLDPVRGVLSMTAAPAGQFLAGEFLSLGDIGTRPTDSTHGTGIWGDKTGIYGLNSNVRQAYLSAANGKIYGGAGVVTLDANGISLLDGSSATAYLRWQNTNGDMIGLIATDSSIMANAMAISSISHDAVTYPDANIEITAYSESGKSSGMSVYTNDAGTNSYIKLQEYSGGGLELTNNYATVRGTGLSIGGSWFSPSSLLHLQSTAPTFRMEDTTASAKSLLVTTDANLAKFEEAGGAANNLLVLDLANARVGIGTASPGSDLHIERAGLAVIAVRGTGAGNHGSIVLGGPGGTYMQMVVRDNPSPGDLEFIDSGFTAVNMQILNAGGVNINRGNLTLSDAVNLATGTTTGTKIGTSTSQKIGFWNTAPIVQPTTAISTATFTANAGTAVNDASTFDGYTLKQVVKALRNVGLLA